MGNADSVVAQKRLARFRPDERPVIEGIFDRLHGTGSSVSSGKSGKVLSLDMLKMTMGKMTSESVIKRVFQGIHSIDPEVPLPPGDGISREQLVIFLADILRGTAEERAPLVLAMAEGAKATATSTEQIRGFMEDLVSATVQTLAHRGHLRAWQPDHMGDETQDQNTCDIPCLEDWLFRIPAMSMFLELLIAESLGVGLPSRPPPTLLPLCQYAPWSDFRCLLNIPLLMFLSPQLPGGHSAPWSLLFSTNIHGESFTRLVGNCKSQGPTVMLVKDTKGHIFGGFVSQSWEVKPQFQGDSRCFLFSVFPYMRVFTCTGYNDHYLYLNQGQHTMPNAFHFTRNKLMDWSRVNCWIIVMFLLAVWTLILMAPIHCRGSMGMGGQHGYFGLWLDYDFGHGHSRARPCCTTYGSPQLSGDEDFKLDTVEVWGVGQPPEEQEKDEEKKKSILDVDPEAQAMMEMTGKTLYSQILREPEEDEEQ